MSCRERSIILCTHFGGFTIKTLLVQLHLVDIKHAYACDQQIILTDKRHDTKPDEDKSNGQPKCDIEMNATQNKYAVKEDDIGENSQVHTHTHTCMTCNLILLNFCKLFARLR